MRRRILFPVLALVIVLSLVGATYLRTNTQSTRRVAVVVSSTTQTTQVSTTTTVAVTSTTSKPRPRVTRPKPPPAPTTLLPTVAGDFRDYVLDCIALHEGNPAYTNGIGTSKKYRGRYQFDQTSWDNVAKQNWGRPDLKGVDIATASAADQDDMAWRYFLHSKYGPWPPSQGKCREHA